MNKEDNIKYKNNFDVVPVLSRRFEIFILYQKTYSRLKTKSKLLNKTYKIP